MLIFGVGGARILHVIADGYFWDYVHLCTDPSLVDWPYAEAECVSVGGAWDAASGCHPAETDCFAWAKFWAGGLTYYGGFIGAALGAFWLLRRDRFPFWKAADMAGFAVPLGLAFGRVGCFLGGCCFGARCDSAWGVSFPAHSPASEAQAKLGLLPSAGLASLPVHPTQLYEALGAIAISLFAFHIASKTKRYDGQVFFVFVALYAVLRFVLEFFRADDRGGIGVLSTSQWIGAVLLVVAALGHVWRRNASTPSVKAV